ncbi:GNAT family N-acetyltransferase [Carboxylicivirga sp. N1Y90]|uniref:GNAT family N-acetyltransferase n=1 Tax=Carboxylicivirga fragile TaxID=3417571 RepID=UPI003D35296E|nr:GNAT family N-acetyltransferase [Marinilabiliaceae bacterium N1Y90]
MQTIIKSFEELTTTELYELLKLRAEIFVVEQDCVYNDLDNNDQIAHHLMIIEDDLIVGYARMLNVGTRFPKASIGRLVVAKEARFKGIARKVMTEAANWMKENWELDSIHISAQKYLKAFYGSLGYEIVTEEYLEDGIPHLGMDLYLGNK